MENENKNNSQKSQVLKNLHTAIVKLT